MIYLGKCSMCLWHLLGRVFYKIQSGHVGLWLFKSTISLLIFCLLVLSINERGVFKFPTIIVDLPISPCN